MATKKEILAAGKFFLFLIVAFAALSIATALFPPNFFEKITASSSNAVFSILGIKGTLGEKDSEVFVQITNGPKIIYSALCTGVLETILLVSAIAASFEIHWKKRALGITVGIAAVFLLNQLRIAITTLAILNASLETAEFTHNVLFRVFLFISIAGIFAVWYWLAGQARK